MEQKQQLPNATAVLVLGICSIVFFCGVGLILGIIGIALSTAGRKLYRENPSLYDNYGVLNAGYIMSIIGTCISGIFVIIRIITVLVVGGALLSLGSH